MKIAYVLLLGTAAVVAQGAQAGECDHERPIDMTLDVSGSEHLEIIAGAGELEVRGRAGLAAARVVGRLCVSTEEWAKQAGVETEAGKQAVIAVRIPDMQNGWSWSGNSYVFIDLEIEVPDDLSLGIRDSSGDLRIRGVGPVAVRDSSGDLEIEDVVGDVKVADSSGDIELSNVQGEVFIEHDSSGDIEGQDIHGGVWVAKDSSGNIRFRRVRGDFVVERDSSGDIVAREVGGDFRVDHDGSGSITALDVDGEITLPDKG